MSAIFQSKQMSPNQWKQRKASYHSKIRPWMDAYRHRRERRQVHPVHDFLFEYYQFNRKLVYQWHPSFGEVLEREEVRKFLSERPSILKSQKVRNVFEFLSSFSLRQQILLFMESGLFTLTA